MTPRFRLRQTGGKAGGFRQTIVLPPAAVAATDAVDCGCADVGSAWIEHLLQTGSGYFPELSVDGASAVVTGEGEVRLAFALTGQIVAGHTIAPAVEYFPESGGTLSLVPGVILDTETSKVWSITLFEPGYGVVTFSGECAGAEAAPADLEVTYAAGYS
jgi:hypothetical protein